METFKLFIILPTEEVCSLRHLETGITVRDIRCKLEMLAGFPAQTYRLIGTDEKILHEDQDLILGKNVWDGFILRMQLLNSWQPLYDAVVQDDIAWILEQGAVHLKDYKVDVDDDLTNDDQEQARRMMGERGGVALYIACWSGKDKMCRALLGVGVDPNARTPFRRSPIFACVAQDNDTVLETMLTHGAKLSVKDYFGDTAMDVAKRNFARLCVNRMRSFQLMHRKRSSPRPGSPCNSSISGTPRSAQIQVAIDSPRPTSRVKSGRSDRGRLSMNENGSLINDRRFSNQNGMARESTFGGYQCRAHVFQMSPRAMTTVTQSSPRHSSLASSSPRGKGEFLDRGSRTASGVQFRLALPQTNSTQSKSKNYVTWDDPLTNTEFLTVGGTKNRQPHCHEANDGGMHSERLSPPKNGVATETSASKGTFNENTKLSSPRSCGGGYDNDTISTDAQSVESAPQGQMSRDRILSRGMTMTPNLRGKLSARTRRQIKSSQKKSESLTTAKRRIQLSEQLKLDAKRRESFEQWLKRKRIQQLKDQSKQSMDGSSSEEDRDVDSSAFNDWLKEVKERPSHKPNPNSAVSLHQRKTRALQGLIEIGDTTPPEMRVAAERDVSSYMYSHQDWLKKRANANGETQDHSKLGTENAKKALESKRLDLLTMAVSFDEWMAFNDQRKTVMKKIEKEDKSHLKEVGLGKQPADVSGKELTFDQWKQQVEAKDARMKLKQLRIRQRQELEKHLRNSHRNSSSVPHEEWLKKKTQESQLQQHINNQLLQQNDRAKSTMERKRNPDRAFQTWVNAKQDKEIQRLDTGIRKEKQLLLQLREKKHVTISC